MPVSSNEQLIKKIEEVLSQLRPAIKQDGGDIAFVSYTDGIVSLKLLGACQQCPFSLYTLKLGIEDRLKQEIPEIKEVVAAQA
jgi:Fe-S cluster biogenesis protein NfuA